MARSDSGSISVHRKLTLTQLAEVNHHRSCGIAIRQIAAGYGLTELELKIQIASGEKQRQLAALRRQAGGVGR